MTPPTPRLSDDEMRAWKSFRLMARHLEAHLARELAQSSALSMQDYDVLSTIAALPGHRWCTKLLMHHLQWSYSRLSHHLDRMENRGLVGRSDCSHGTGTDVAATETGLDAIRAASAGHIGAVRSAFIERLKPGDLATLERLGNAVVGGLPGPTAARGW